MSIALSTDSALLRVLLWNGCFSVLRFSSKQNNRFVFYERSESKAVWIMKKSEKTQSRYVHVKTVYDPEKVKAWLLNWRPDIAIVYASHLDCDCPHTHLILRFPSVVQWRKFRSWLNSPRIDPHSYVSAARSWVKSCRYVLHLDNPEKERVPFDRLKWVNIDDSEVSMMMGNRKAPILADLASLGSRSSFQAFEFLVCQRGHNASEVSSAIRCLIDLERFRTFKKETGCDVEKIADLSSDFQLFNSSMEDSLISEF